MHKRKIHIRSDGNTQIGLGHLVRCIALGHMLKNEFSIHFVCRDAPDPIIKEIKEAGFSFLKLTKELEFLVSIQAKDIVVLDHYGLTSNYQKQIKEIGCKLVCIDDIPDKKFWADLIINHAPNVDAKTYQAQPYTQFALGLDYALLRPIFIEAAKQKREVDNVDAIFICFGGADERNLTQQTLELVQDTKDFKRIIIVIGAAYQYKEALASTALKIPELELYSSISAEQMLALMKDSELAIVPASGLLLEALSVGCKVISGMYIENQKLLYSQYKQANRFIDAGDFSIQNTKKALDKVNLDLNQRTTPLLDGNSPTRLLKLFKQLKMESDISLKVAQNQDLEQTFKWATDSRIRSFSFNQSEIKKEDHVNWFYTKLKDENCAYYIAHKNEKALGSIRFDIKNRTAVISYLIDAELHGQSYGLSLLKLGIEKLVAENEIKHILGHVMPENIPSIKAFEKLGFKKILEGKNYKFIKTI